MSKTKRRWWRAEDLSSQLKLKQRMGIFQVPAEIEEKQWFQLWQQKFKEAARETPLVIKEEDYLREGVAVKIHNYRQFVSKLANYGILRFRVPGDSGYNPGEGERSQTLSTLSLAQAISAGLGISIERVLKPRRYFSSPDFLQGTPSERIGFLHNAYTGTFWFERFKRRQAKIASRVSPPKVREWQRISRNDLRDWFIVANEDPESGIPKLCSSGLVIPRDGKFESKSRNNIVNPEALAKLISLLYDVKLEDVLVKREDDSYLKELANTFLERRLIPYLRKKGIHPFRNYPLVQASAVTHIPYSTLSFMLDELISLDPRDETRKVNGLELAVYALRKAKSATTTVKEVCDMLGIEEQQFGMLGIRRITENDTVSRTHYVIPLYDEIAKEARDILLKKLKSEKQAVHSFGAIPVEIQNKIYLLTQRARSYYCKQYGIPIYDDAAHEHLLSQLNNGIQVEDRTIKTRDLRLVINRGNFITGITLDSSAPCCIGK